MSPIDTGLLLHYAMRYAMGRYTYAVDDMVRMIREQWQWLTTGDRNQLLADLDSNVRRHENDGKTLGAEYTFKQWRDLRDWMVEQ